MIAAVKNSDLHYFFLAMTIPLSNAVVLTAVAQGALAVSHFLLLEEEEKKKKRARATLQQRCRWDRFVLLNHDRPMFRRHLRMTYGSFLVLLDKIRPNLPVIDEKMGDLRGGVIIPELRLYSTIRYLAGASYTDICFFCRISSQSFYRILYETMDAINRSIEIKFPSSPEDCAAVAASFEDISYSGVISNCVGVLDGYLLAITTPSKKTAKNVRSYFSGHYRRNGINIQACCDSSCRFTFVGVGGPGVTKDRVAVSESGLLDLVEALPQGYICIGDCAYQPTERLVPIFGGDLALKPDNDNFNYYASQLRIRIEMAFGLMSRKWGILQKPLANQLPNYKHLICCIARLHNFCIDERLKVDAVAAGPTGGGGGDDDEDDGGDAGGDGGGHAPGAGGGGAGGAAFHTRSSLSFEQLAYMNACAQVRSKNMHVVVLLFIS